MPFRVQGSGCRIQGGATTQAETPPATGRPLTPGSSSLTPLKLVCAWCGKTIRAGDETKPTSHGICLACKEVQKQKIAVLCASAVKGDVAMAPKYAEPLKVEGDLKDSTDRILHALSEIEGPALSEVEGDACDRAEAEAAHAAYDQALDQIVEEHRRRRCPDCNRDLDDWGNYGCARCDVRIRRRENREK